MLFALRNVGTVIDSRATTPGGTREGTHLIVADIQTVKSWGWDGRKLLKELIKLDYENLEELRPKDEGNVEQWTPIFEEHVDTWRLLVDPDRTIIGYWHFMPLFDAEFALAKKGELVEGSVSVNELPPLLPGHFNIYFVTILLQVQYRHTGAKVLLFNSMLDVLEDLAKQGVFINEVCANAYTKAGEAVCRSLGMTSIADHVTHGKIYARSFYPFPSNAIFEKRKSLSKLYKAEFDGGSVEGPAKAS